MEGAEELSMMMEWGLCKAEKRKTDGDGRILSCVQMQFHYVNQLSLDHIWFKTFFFCKENKNSVYKIVF